MSKIDLIRKLGFQLVEVTERYLIMTGLSKKLKKKPKVIMEIIERGRVIKRRVAYTSEIKMWSILLERINN